MTGHESIVPHLPTAARPPLTPPSPFTLWPRRREAEGAETVRLVHAAEG